MLNDPNSFNKENRNLSEVFKELQAIKNGEKSIEPPVYSGNQKTSNLKNQFNFGKNKNINSNKNSDLKLSHIISGCAILIIGMAIFFPKSIFFNESYAREENMDSDSEYEINRHSLNIGNIISGNIDTEKIQEQVIEEREVEYEITYNNNPELQKSEEIVLQEGILGKDKITAIKSYENGEFVEELILARSVLIEPISKIIDLGTSEFLAKHKVHIGDTMYLLDTFDLMEEADTSSVVVAEIKKSLDVKLLELPSEEWCRVSFDGLEGYIQTSKLTSSFTTPTIIERNRIQRILIKVNIDMELNRPSGLTLNDYKKIFTGLSSDNNRVFQNNYSAFYNAERKYNINGIFLAAIAIHESAWGSSQIAQDKNNLFGYGAYDATPYESAFTFETYEDGIETVAKSLVKYYLNPSGTRIYDGETAAAWYYNGPTLLGVNTRYATDAFWHTKVFRTMESLYDKL